MRRSEKRRLSLPFPSSFPSFPSPIFLNSLLRPFHSMTASNDKRRLGTSQVCERGTLSFKNGIVKGKGLDLRTERTRTKLC